MAPTTPDPDRPDPRIVRSEALIRAAFLELLQSARSFESLTVSEVARCAGVTRKTFYARFGSLDALVRAILDDLFADISMQIDDARLRFPLTDRALSRLVFGAYEARQSELAPLISQCPPGLFIESVQQATGPLLDRALAINAAPAMNAARREYVVCILASVVHGVLSVWARRDFAEAPEDVAELVDMLLATGVERVVLESRRG